MIREINVRSVLNKHKKRDEWFLDDYSVNPYEGCSFNCAYCYIRGSKYGENLSEKLAVKSNAAELLDKQLFNRAKKGQYGFIALASATDPYLPVDNTFQLTRQILEIILKHRFPVFIATKSTHILRDLELLIAIDKQAILPGDLKETLKRGAIISFSMSSFDEAITNIFEPGAPKPIERLQTLQKIKEADLLAGVNAIPVLPYISDTDEQLDSIIRHAKTYRADYILVGGLTLFGEGPSDSKTLVYKLLSRHYPELVMKYQNLFGHYYLSRQYQEELDRRVLKFCEKYNIRNRIIFM